MRVSQKLGKKKFGGTVWAYVGKSDYGRIWEGQSIYIRISRFLHGFSYYGSANYPVASTYILPDGRTSKLVKFD